MGKTTNKVACQFEGSLVGQTSSVSDVDLLKDAARKVGAWSLRTGAINPNLSMEEQIRAKSRALIGLTNNAEEQRALIRIAQQAKEIMDRTKESRSPQDKKLFSMARHINDRSREMILLCHNGMIEKDVMTRAHLLKAEPGEDAKEVLRQEAWAAINKAIDSYKFDAGANPLTYFRRGQIRHFLSKAVDREGGEAGVRLKSRNEDGKRVDAIAREIKSEGRPITVAEIAERLHLDPTEVAEILPVVSQQAVRLDAPLRVHDTEELNSTHSDILLDESTDTENEVIAGDARNRVRLAISEIKSPVRRRLLEMTYGIGGEEVEQKDIFDGVYIDGDGQRYSAESTIVSDRKRRGVKVEKLSQKELNSKFNSGALNFEPGTAEAYEMARVAKGQFSASEEFSRFITNETGMPLTSGMVYDSKSRGEDELRSSPHLVGMADAYHGPDELENSESARERVRRALIRKGAVADPNAKNLRSARSKSGGKSKLRELAEDHGMVDDQGRLVSDAVILSNL